MSGFYTSFMYVKKSIMFKAAHEEAVDAQESRSIPGTDISRGRSLCRRFHQFVLVFNPSPMSDGGPVECAFAAYPRAGKSDMVAESTWGRFDFLEAGSSEWKDITSDVLPVGVFRKFFDDKYLAQHQDDLPTEGHGMVNRQSEVEGPEVFHYLLTIPQIGTKTLLSVDGQTSNDYPQDANDLIAALKYHHMDLTWDIKQGVFKIARVY
jgi:hypothetical protein